MNLKVLFSVLFSVSVLTLNAQYSPNNESEISSEKFVEKQMYGLETGLLGVWFYSEFGMSSVMTFRTELGIDYGLFGGVYYVKKDHYFSPVLAVEARWYYNIRGRSDEQKRTSNNSSNYFGLKLLYNPNWFYISSKDNSEFHPHITFVPKWSIRRNISKHFNYEIGLGLGYRYIFYEDESNKGELALDLNLRIGYIFK